MRRRGQADGGWMRDLIGEPLQSRMRPGGGNGADKSRALAEALQPALLGRLQGDGQGADFPCPGPVLQRNRAIHGAEKDQVAAPGAVAQHALDPALERRRVRHLARFDRPLEPVAVAERADRKGRREPRLQLDELTGADAAAHARTHRLPGRTGPRSRRRRRAGPGPCPG